MPATEAAALGEFDLAYLDPPYNQHRYESNYHIWETIVAWDAPEHYGVACKRAETRTMARSPFNARRAMPGALAGVVRDVRARVLVLSYNDESWVALDELVEMCRVPGSRRGARLRLGPLRRAPGSGSTTPPASESGTVGRLRNVEYVLVAGDRAEVRRLVAPWRAERVGAGGELTPRGGPANVGGDRGRRAAARRHGRPDRRGGVATWVRSTGGWRSSPGPAVASAASTRCCSPPRGPRSSCNDLGGAVDGSGDDRSPAEQVVDEIRAMGGEAVANADDITDWEGGERLVDSGRARRSATSTCW